MDKPITRRKLLATIGIAGAATALCGSSLGLADGEGAVVQDVYGNPGLLKRQSWIGPATVSELRAKKKAANGELYYVTDRGKEGYFYCDAADVSSADNTGTVLVSSSGLRFKRMIDGEFIHATWFDAKADGVADDTAAIQAAIDWISAAGERRPLYFSPGTYLVSPSVNARIVLRSNLHLTGTHHSIIKVKPDAGDYPLLFGPATNGAYIENVTVSNLTIDQNGGQNTTCNVQHGNSNSTQYVFAFFNFRNIVVDNVRFDSICGVNTVVMNGNGSKHAVVRNCFFRFKRTAGAANYDNSAVYFNCDEHAAIDNVFMADIAEKAFGAIETHNGLSVISGNLSEGYQTGVNIVSQSSSAPTTREHSDITVTGNTFSKANQAIKLWPITGKPLRNVVVSGNTISIANKDHNDRMSGGIITELDNVNHLLSGAVENVVITGNSIQFQIETDSRAISNSTIYAIGITPKGNVSNVIVSDNVIVNAPVAGIKVGLYNSANTFSNISVRNNTIVNAGICQFAIRDYCAAVFLTGNLRNVRVEDNTISDTFATLQGYQSFYASGGVFHQVSIRNNQVSSLQGGYWSRLANAGIDTGAAVSTYYSSTFPVTEKLSVKSGDVIVNTGNLAVGQYHGYRASSGGTFGTLSGVTANTWTGSPVLVVNNSSTLAVGDTISVAGSTQAMQILRISGTTIHISPPCPATLIGAAVSYVSPAIRPFGQIV